MSVPAKYAHTNRIARDWRALAAFYEAVFGCTPVPPERDLSGPWLDAATTVPGVRLRGVRYAADPEGNVVELQSWSGG